MTDYIARAGRLALAVLLLSLAFGYGVVHLYSSHWQPPSEHGITFDRETLELVAIEPGSAAERAGLKKLDRLEALDGIPVSSLLQVEDALRHATPGTTARLTVNLAALNRPRAYEVELRARPAAERTSWMATLGEGWIRSIPLLLLGVAAFVLVLRPSSREAWLLALVSIGIVATVPLLTFFAKIPPAWRVPAVSFKLLFGAAAPPLAYIFFALFPERSPLDRLYPEIKSAWLLVALGVATPFAVWSAVTHGSGFYQTAWPVAGLWLTGISWIAVAGSGGFALWHASCDGESDEIRRKARVVGTAFLLALVPYAAIRLTALFAGRSLESMPVWLRVTGAMGLLLAPFGIGYVLMTPRLLPVPVLLKRQARYLLVERGAIGLVVIAAGIAALAIADRVSGAMTHRVPIGLGIAAVVWIGLVWACMRGHRRMSRGIDRLLFPSIAKTRRILEELPERIDQARSAEELTQLLHDAIAEALQPDRLAIYVRSDAKTLKVACGDVPGDMDEIPLTQRLPRDLMQEGDLADDEEPPAFGSLQYVVQVGPECLVPVIGREPGLRGMLVLGARPHDEPYTLGDKCRLATAATCAGLALERLRAESAVA